MTPEQKPTMDEVLNDEYWKFVEEIGLTSIHTKLFPEAYKQQALRAMKEWEQICMKERDEEIKKWETGFKGMEKLVFDHKKEIERLKGLIKQLYIMYNREVMFPDKIEKQYEQFKTENNL